MPFSHKLSKLNQLTLSDWWILMISVLLLPIIAFALHWKGYQWTKSRLAHMIKTKTTSSLPPNEQLAVAKSVSYAVSVAGNHGPYRANCLKKSIVAWWLLARRNIPTDLKMGVNKESDELNAHAWLEHRGNILLDSKGVSENFLPFIEKTENHSATARNNQFMR